eukprot:Filipodium_phascolosomae@DN634_c0_g1_i1.p1
MSDSEGESKEAQKDLSDEATAGKYRAAADIANAALTHVASLCIAGANIYDICVAGDELINSKCALVFNAKKNGKKMEKGVAFPTCVSVNELCGHMSPMAKEDEELQHIIKDGDVAKIDLGCHIDSFIAVAAHTIVIGASTENPVTGRKADLIKATWHAMELAACALKVGNTNGYVSEVIQKTAAEFKINLLEGVLSHRLKKHIIDGNQVIAQRELPTDPHKIEPFTIKPYEVYGLDVIFTTGEGKPKDSDHRTTIYKRNVEVNYSLKTATGRKFLGVVNQTYPTMPFTGRSFEDKSQWKMGVYECMRHQLLNPYPVLREKAGELVAQFKCTILVLPTGQRKVTGLTFDQRDLIQSEYAIKDASLLELELTANSLTATRKERKKQKADEDGSGATNNESSSSSNGGNGSGAEGSSGSG